MRRLTTLALCVCLLCGCTTGRRSYAVDIHGRTWSTPAVIEFPNSDTTNLYDISIALRHNGLRVGDTVEFTVRTVTPDSLWVEEPVRLCITDDGRSRPAQHEAAATYRRNVRLSREGVYTVTLTPSQPVSGVTAVGIDLSRSGGGRALNER